MIGAVARKLFGSANETADPQLSAAGSPPSTLGAELKACPTKRSRPAPPIQETGRRRRFARRHPVPAFATVREAARRVIGQRHFDVS